MHRKGLTVPHVCRFAALSKPKHLRVFCQILTWQSLYLLSLVTYFCDFHVPGLVHNLSPVDTYLEIIVVTRSIPVLSSFWLCFDVVSEEYGHSIRAYQENVIL